MAKLSVVATPIGNLEDITLRALRVLKEADSIVCEDTRVTGKLLAHFSISKPLLSFRGAPKDFERVLRVLASGKRIALVSDAGTPSISDPGLELVSRAREEFGDSIVIEAIPGPSALAAALSIAGLRASTFMFWGFLPLKKGREKMLTEIAGSVRASVLYESPHRLVKTLVWLAAHLPAQRRVGVFRELTKIHEEAVIGSPREVCAAFERHPERQRGECTIVVEGAK